MSARCMENNQSAARAARCFLAERVRDDWAYPHPPARSSCSDDEAPRPSELRERYYGSTSEPDSDSETSAAADPYQFDSPDSIGAALETKAQSRKRKRSAALASEMEWNRGLACFVDRRDAWTGVTKSSPAAVASDAPLDARVPVAPRLLPDNAIRLSITPRVYADIYDKVVVASRTPTVPINLADMTRALVQGWKDSGEWPPKSAPLDPLVGRKRAVLAGVKMEPHGPFLEHHPHMKKGVDSVRRIFQRNGHHEHSPVENNG